MCDIFHPLYLSIPQTSLGPSISIPTVQMRKLFQEALKSLSSLPGGRASEKYTLSSLPCCLACLFYTIFSCGERDLWMVGERPFSSCSMWKNMCKDSTSGSILYSVGIFLKFNKVEHAFFSFRDMTIDVLLLLMFSSLVHVPISFTEEKLTMENHGFRLWVSRW